MAFETKNGNIKIITYIAVVKDGKILLVDYVQAPNSGRSGWWIPAPELEYGEHPEERVNTVLDSLGLNGETATLQEVESFETGTGWNLIFHYLVKTNKEITPDANIQRHDWFTMADLPGSEEIAHGKWERNIAQTRIHASL